MKTFVIYPLGILTILAGLTTSNAEVDCHKPPPHIDFGNCCQINYIITEEVKSTCEGIIHNMHTMDELEEFRYQFGPHRGPPGHHRGHRHHGLYYHCFMSCVLNETGIVIDGEFQEDNMLTYLNQVYDDSEIVDFVGEQLRKCNVKRESMAVRKPKNKHGPLHCLHNHGHMLFACNYIHTFKNCPDSVWSNTDECNAAREYFRECKPPHHPTKEEDVEEIEEDIDEGFEEEDVEIEAEAEEEI